MGSCDAVGEDDSVVVARKRERSSRKCHHCMDKKDSQSRWTAASAPSIRGEHQQSRRIDNYEELQTGRDEKKSGSSSHSYHSKQVEEARRQQRKTAKHIAPVVSKAVTVIPPTELELEAARRNQARLERKRRNGQSSPADGSQPDPATPYSLPIWLRPKDTVKERDGEGTRQTHYGRRYGVCDATDQASAKDRLDARVISKRF